MRERKTGFIYIVERRNEGEEKCRERGGRERRADGCEDCDEACLRAVTKLVIIYERESENEV